MKEKLNYITHLSNSSTVVNMSGDGRRVPGQAVKKVSGSSQTNPLYTLDLMALHVVFRIFQFLQSEGSGLVWRNFEYAKS